MHHISPGKQLLLLTLSLLISLHGCYDAEPGASSTDIIPDSQSEIEVEIWELINEYRMANELSSLQLDSTISDIARQHSQDMAAGRVPVGHDGFSERVEAIRNRIGGRSTAENVAAGYPSAKAVTDGWINSSGHQQNIVGEYHLTGVGVAYADDDTPYYTQIFVLR